MLKSLAIVISASQLINQSTYQLYLAAFLATGLTVVLVGLLLPKEPLNIFPFFVFLSPLPIKLNLFLCYVYLESTANIQGKTTSIIIALI
jgi:hypothetical protein